LEQCEKALAACEEAVRAKPDDAEAWYNKGVALDNLQRTEEALHSYNKALELDPEYPQAWEKKGVALDKLNRSEEALQCFEEALKLKPDYAQARAMKKRSGASRKHSKSIATWYRLGITKELLCRIWVATEKPLQ
jgi:Flp pilus assembly protein TadD